MVLAPKRRRFTVAEYHQMAQAGILDEDDRVELLDGEIIEMPPIGPRHMASVLRLTDLFQRWFGESALVSVQNPIRLGQRSEPQPDVVLLRRQPDYYASSPPTRDNVLLLVEVADTSVELDRRVKVPLYARGGIREVWLIDLGQETITVYRDPTRSGYRTAQVLRHGEHLAPLAFPDRPLAVADLLG